MEGGGVTYADVLNDAMNIVHHVALYAEYYCNSTRVVRVLWGPQPFETGICLRRQAVLDYVHYVPTGMTREALEYCSGSLAVAVISLMKMKMTVSQSATAVS